MSPRSKEQLINKIKIEHMIWKTEVAFDRKDVENKAIEITGEEEEQRMRKARHQHLRHSVTQSFYASKVDKIAILKQKNAKLSFAVPKTKIS